MPKIKVLIAEDHAVVRDGLRILLSTEPDFVIAGEAEDGRKAIHLAKKLKPDVVLMDLTMPTCNGLDATQSISRQLPASKVLVLSAHSDDDSVRQVMQAGAAGYLTKHSAAEDLLKAIREVNRGNSFLSPMIARRWRRQSRKAFLNGADHHVPRNLSRREVQVLKLIAGGLCNKEIAAELGRSIKTVEKHRQQVMDKLDIHEVAGLTRYAIGRGMLPPRTTPLLRRTSRRR